MNGRVMSVDIEWSVERMNELDDEDKTNAVTLQQWNPASKQATKSVCRRVIGCIRHRIAGEQQGGFVLCSLTAKSPISQTDHSLECCCCCPCAAGAPPGRFRVEVNCAAFLCVLFSHDCHGLYVFFSDQSTLARVAYVPPAVLFYIVSGCDTGSLHSFSWR